MSSWLSCELQKFNNRRLKIVYLVEKIVPIARKTSVSQSESNYEWTRSEVPGPWPNYLGFSEKDKMNWTTTRESDYSGKRYRPSRVLHSSQQIPL